VKPHDYVVTYSGAEVSQTRGVPTEEDLALSLSRQPRFGGFCRRHWTVLDHSLFVSILAERDNQPAAVQLAALLHDAHEWTGDIPTHFKTEDQRDLQRNLDFKVALAYAPQVSLLFWNSVKEYDHRALLAEALIVGPPLFQFSRDVLEHFGARPNLRDVVALVVRLRRGELGVNPNELNYKLDAQNVKNFLTRLHRLQLEVAITKDPEVRNRCAEPKGFLAHETRREQ